MTLQECLDRLGSVELSNLGIVDNNLKIKVINLPKVLNCIQSALTHLYTTFFLKESSIFIDLIDGKVEYELLSKHNVPDNLKADYDHYIFKNCNEKFNDDIIKITNVYLNSGRELTINDASDPESIFIPQYNLIQIPFELPCMELAISYQANHPKISKDNLTMELEIPTSFELAFLIYTTYLIASAINSEIAINYAQQCLNRYSLVTTELLKASANDFADSNENIKFKINGWC